MKKFLLSIAPLSMLCALLAGCGDEPSIETTYETVDTSKPVVFTDFSPKEGQVRTSLYIYGENFGTDESLIHVYVGGVEARTIGSTGTIIYAMVMKHSYDGDVMVEIEDGDGNIYASYTFDEKFTYNAQYTVGTLIRVVDEDGESGFSEGSIDDGEASIPSSDWMMFDPAGDTEDGDHILYTSNWYDGMRIINLTQRTVEKVFSASQYKCLFSYVFSNDLDTLFLSDDNGRASDTTLPNLYYCLRSENFRKFRPYCYAPCTYSMVEAPNCTKFYASWTNAAIYRMENPTGEIPHVDTDRTTCFRISSMVQTDGVHTRMIPHPSGEYMYLINETYGIVLRSNYNEEENMYEFPTIIAGSFSESGAREGVGSAARFASPWQGCFVYNESYSSRADGEMYDFYFTGKDDNHCVWKLTPDAVLSLYAGRSNYNSDGSYSGYIDGDPLTEARFYGCSGMAYDPDDQTFYIGDNYNYAVRYIAVE